MKAVPCHGFSGPADLQIGDAPDPAPADVPKLAMNLPLLKKFSIVGVFAGAWEDKEPEAARQVKETLMSWVADEKIQPHIGMGVPMEAIREAMMAIQSRTSSGRVVVAVK